MVTEIGFGLLVAFVAVQRVAELRLSARNEKLLRAAGAVEHAPGQLPKMALVHVAWLAGASLEVFVLGAAFEPWLATLAIPAFVLGQVLRRRARRTLGWRWSVRILVLPGRPPVASGPFRHVRHPNYLGVILELAALPLIHGAWITALVVGVANGWLVRQRIRAEEAALVAAGGYTERFGDRPRLLPRLSEVDLPWGT